MPRRYDLIVIGGGTAGIVASTTAAGIGARVALIERERIGGDCLYTGCVPSKTLLASAERAQAMREADAYGIASVDPSIDFPAVMERVAETIATGFPEDDPDALREQGVEVIIGEASFLRPGVIATGGRELEFRRAIIATGSRPVLPPIPGLDRVEPLTNETVFELRRQPQRLAVLGGGPIGCELGQAFARLGSEVTILEAEPRLLPREEPEAGALLAERLVAEGVDVRTGTRVAEVEPAAAGGGVAVQADGGRLEFDRILVATGRRAVTSGLGLEQVGVELSADGSIAVDDRLWTTGQGILAAGDVTGDLQFTHFAAYQALIAMANGLFRTRQRSERNWVPWTTFTDPEIARVGLTEEQARAEHGSAVEIFHENYANNDRAITSGRTGGFAKLIAGKRGKLLGATIAGPASGETINESARVIRDGGKVQDVSQMIHVYPTYGEGPARAADDYWRRRFFQPRVQRLMRPLLAFLRMIDRPR